MKIINAGEGVNKETLLHCPIMADIGSSGRENIILVHLEKITQGKYLGPTESQPWA